MEKYISIIVPVYNVESYLDKCIASIVNQTSHEWEAILVDDGSTDNSGAICDKWASQCQQIKVIHQTNKGLSGARNAGINLARGEYILLLDSDDYLELTALEKISSRLHKNKPDILYGKALTVDNNGNKQEKMKYHQFSERVYLGKEYLEKLNNSTSIITFCAQFGVYSRKFLNKNDIRFCEGLIHEDELWTPCVLLKAKTVFYMDEFFYNHYVREGSIMHSGNIEKSAINTIQVCMKLREIYEEYPKKQIKYLRDRLAMLYLRAIPYYPCYKQLIELFGRGFPMKYASSKKNRVKSLLYFVTPRGYCFISKRMRK